MYNYGYYQQPYFGAMPDAMQQLRQPYQQPQTYQQPQPQVQQATGDERIYVQGEVGAKAYLVAPGNTVTLWDSERQTIYLKTVSPTGIPSMQCLNYTVDAPKTDATPKDDKVLTGRIEALESAVNALKSKLAKMEVVTNEPATDDTAV